MIDSPGQKWNPEQYVDQAGFVSELGMPVVELLAPQKNERILELGCGEGALTIKLQNLGCQVTGVDSSPEMISKAKSTGLEVHVADGEALEFQNEFDAVFSNAALHWMTQPRKVIAGVWQALKPEGRFVGEFGGQGNVALIKTALESALTSRHIDFVCPWFFPSPAEYRTMLEEQGFQVDSIELIPRPTPLPGEVRGWLETFAQPYTKLIPVAKQYDFLTEVTKALKPSLCDDQGNWFADYVRLRFSAHKPGN